MIKYTREQIVAAATEAAAKAKGRLCRVEFCREFGISRSQIDRLFVEGWQEVRRLAGITRPNPRNPLSDDQLLERFHSLALKLGFIPSAHTFARSEAMSPDTVRRRFGPTEARLQRYRAWLERNHPESPFLPLLISGLLKSATQTGLVFGAPTNLYGLRCAPTNEQGVIFLFGILSWHLGIAVEGIRSAYPDCVAKRCVDRKNNRWELVRIEFEYSSSNFREHGHDPAGCDLIVCWQHDWPQCPLEVIELRAVVDRLTRNLEAEVSCQASSS